MPVAYSKDIRTRVIAQVESGGSRREVAEDFEVSASTAVKWVARFHETGECGAKPRGGSISPLDEVVSAMRKRKLSGSRTALWRFFARHGITFKKKPARSGAEARRRRAGTPTLDTRARHA
jgi:transposase